MFFVGCSGTYIRNAASQRHLFVLRPAAQFHAIGPKSNRNRSSNLARTFPSIFRAESLPAWINWRFTTYEPQTVRTTCWDDLLVSNASPGRTDEAAGAIEISTRMVAPRFGLPG